jgi:hypothetical protein
MHAAENFGLFIALSRSSQGGLCGSSYVNDKDQPARSSIS